jgi:hypothetical protein
MRRTPPCGLHGWTSLRISGLVSSPKNLTALRLAIPRVPPSRGACSAAWLSLSLLSLSRNCYFLRHRTWVQRIERSDSSLLRNGSTNSVRIASVITGSSLSKNDEPPSGRGLSSKRSIISNPLLSRISIQSKDLRRFSVPIGAYSSALNFKNSNGRLKSRWSRKSIEWNMCPPL